MTPPAVFQRVVAVFEKTTRSTRSRRLQPRPEAGLGKLTLTRCLRVRRFTRAPYSFQPPSCTGRSRARLPSIAMTTRAPPRHSRVRAHTDTARAPKRAGLKLIDPLRPRTTARPPEAVRSLYASAVLRGACARSASSVRLAACAAGAPATARAAAASAAAAESGRTARSATPIDAVR